MENKLFCSTCGSECQRSSAYCHICGMPMGQHTTQSFSTTRQSHCTGCGAKLEQRNAYCPLCGIECLDYQAASSGTQIKDFISDFKLPSGAAGKASVNLAPTLAQVKDSSVYMPAVIFGLVAIGAGLILSFLLDIVLKQTLAGFIDGLIENALGLSARDGIKSGELKLGPVTMWLLSCLGGLGVGVSGNSAFRDISGINKMSYSLSFGYVVLMIIPVISLLIARQARNAFVKSQYNGREIRSIDGVLGAFVFVLLNMILTLIPTPMGSALKRAANDGISGMYDNIKINVGYGALFWNLLIFGFLIAVIFAMPSIKQTIGSARERKGVVGSSCVAAINVIKHLLICGAILAVIIVGYTMFKISKDGGLDNMKLKDLLLILASLPNIAVWTIAGFFGGAVAMKGEVPVTDMFDYGSATVSLNVFGMKASASGDSEKIYSWVGFILLIAGLWIAVTAIYKFLRDDEQIIAKGIVVTIASAIGVWAMSVCAVVGQSAKITGEYKDSMSGSLSSASLTNFILCAIFMGVAVGIVYAAKKIPQLDDIVKKAATLPICSAITAAAAIVLCLTAKLA